MAYNRKSYVEHVAVSVKDIEWHIEFFKEALGMAVYNTIEESPDSKQVWTIGGMQLISDPDFEESEKRIAHLGIMTEDLEECLQEVYKWGVTELPQGRNWFALPDGLCIELIQAKGDSVAEILNVNPRD